MISKKIIDLSTQEGYNEYNETLDELKEQGNDLFKLLGIDGDLLINQLKDLGTSLYNDSKNKDEEDKNENDNHFERPSEKLTTDQKLQLHKLVGEYVDTMIKPYNNGHLTNSQINDAYAGLYEFGAWILNR